MHFTEIVCLTVRFCERLAYNYYLHSLILCSCQNVSHLFFVTA